MASVQSKWIGLLGFVLGFAVFPLLFRTTDNSERLHPRIKTFLPVVPLTKTQSDVFTSTSSMPQTTSQVEADIVDTIKVTIDRRTIEHSQAKGKSRIESARNSPTEFHNILADEVLCANMFRIGRIGDGGKWVCGPQFIADWDRKCVLYSFGINTDPSFEEEFSQITNSSCDIVAVDMQQFPQSITRLAAIGANYVETQLSKNTTLTTTNLKDLMNRFNHSYIDVLKMDIEGSEYLLADYIFEVQVCQMMIELHAFDKNYVQFFEFLKKASKAGYSLVHHEVNFMTLNCIEITLLHSSCFNRFGGIVPLAKYLDVV